MNDFHCRIPSIHYGCGQVKTVGEKAAEHGTRAFVAIDPFWEKHELLGNLKTYLSQMHIEFTVYSDIDHDPSCFSIDEASVIAKQNKCDIVIAIGGGSTMDFGKGVAILAVNDGTSWEYTRRRDHTPREAGKNILPIIAIPTTAGTGSEMTPYSVLTNPRIKEKSSIVTDRIIPTIALIDPELTYSCPADLTALTGVDVLSHAVEAYINQKSSPWTKMVALEAIRKVGRFLRRAVKDGSDSEARQEMSWASALAGIAIAHANPTLPHAMAQAAGGFLHAPHGATIAACFAEVIRRSITDETTVFAEITTALNPEMINESGEQKAVLCPDIIQKLFDDINVNVKFSDFGMKEEDIDRVTEMAMTGYFTGISLHPIVMDEEQIKDIYRACL